MIKKNSGENMKEKNTSGFPLRWVCIIILITAIVTSLTTSLIIYNNSKIVLGSTSLKDDNALREFLKVYNSLEKSYYQDIDKTEMVNAAIAAMLDYLDEDYSTYMSEEETSDLADRLSGKFLGIGISILNNEVYEVYEGSPAEKAGLKSGDILTEINGNTTDGKTTNEISKFLDKTKENTIVVLRGEETYSFQVTASYINTPLNKKLIEIEGKKLAYIQIDSFTNTVGEEFRKALEALESQGSEKVIIDLRGNSGGYLQGAVEIASMFLQEHSLVYSLDEKEKKEDYYDKTSEKRDYEVAILMDESTASASEVLIAALKDNHKETTYLIGKTSFGKGKVQQTKKLDDGSMVKYTSARWLRPDGSCIDEIGITPDFDVDYEKDEEGNFIDTPLIKAIELLI